MSPGLSDAATPDTKTVQSLERLSRILRMPLWDVARESKLSPIQIQFLIYLAPHPDDQRRVSLLADEFGLTQATVSDAVRVLHEKRLVAKVPDAKDGRIIRLDLSAEGKDVVKQVEAWQAEIISRVEDFPSEQKKRALVVLMELIISLQHHHVINTARMCLACSNFRPNIHLGDGAPHHCSLTDTPLGIEDLKIDCQHHLPKQ